MVAHAVINRNDLHPLLERHGLGGDGELPQIDPVLCLELQASVGRDVEVEGIVLRPAGIKQGAPFPHQGHAPLGEGVQLEYRVEAQLLHSRLRGAIRDAKERILAVQAEGFAFAPFDPLKAAVERAVISAA